MYRNAKTITAIVAMAVVLAGSFGGCCTKRDVEAINDRLSMLESQSR